MLEFASPGFLVEKPGSRKAGNRQYRMVVDYRNINSQIKDQARFVPSVDETVENIGLMDAKYFSKMDVRTPISIKLK